MASEIERKFLVKALPAFIQQQPMKAIEQGYLALDPNGKEVRLRNSNGVYSLTVKSSGTLSREEFEVQLSQEQFDQLVAAAGQDKALEVVGDPVSALLIKLLEGVHSHLGGELVLQELGIHEFGSMVTLD